VQVDLIGPAGRLEALLEPPERPVPDNPRFAAVVCHPHPLFGGTLHNHATYRLAKAVRARGGTSLRFNFRGVGRSQGAHDQGRGERDDVRAALAWLRERTPDVPILVAGFSFGAWVAAQAGCRDPAVRGLLLAGLASRSFQLDFIRGCEKPIAAMQAAGDEFGGVDEVRLLLSGSAFPRRLDVLEGATHLFSEDLGGLQRLAESGLSWLMERV
jgi:alpha/beta superfamily hydrolase